MASTGTLRTKKTENECVQPCQLLYAQTRFTHGSIQALGRSDPLLVYVGGYLRISNGVAGARTRARNSGPAPGGRRGVGLLSVGQVVAAQDDRDYGLGFRV
jgi:hypothetical protein